MAKPLSSKPLKLSRITALDEEAVGIVALWQLDAQRNDALAR